MGSPGANSPVSNDAASGFSEAQTDRVIEPSVIGGGGGWTACPMVSAAGRTMLVLIVIIADTGASGVTRLDTEHGYSDMCL